MIGSLNIALIADTFPPIRTSGAVQLRDLSREFVRQGHKLTVILPAADISVPWETSAADEVRVLRLKAPATKGINYIRRTIGELIMPFAMRRNFRLSPLSKEKWDGVVWYSPSIFHGPFVKSIKNESRCKGYLVIRDIFPEWAVDMGLMSRGLAYHFFDIVARYQYSIADVIGVQTKSNCSYFHAWEKKFGRRLDVLQNWLDNPGKTRCTIRICDTLLAGRKIFVYAGNMGVAQGVNVFVDLAEELSARLDIGFLFVGRGSELQRLKRFVKDRCLTNILFFDEIDPDEIPDLYAQCSVGMVALDARHKIDNIPGKFLTYMQNGLPVLANVNAGNDLALMIRKEGVGRVCESNNISELSILVQQILEDIDADVGLSDRCRGLFAREFSVENAVSKILLALTE